jgi:hypothetical protein
MTLGLLAVALTEPLREAVLRLHPAVSGPPPQVQTEDIFERYVDLGAYVLEHLGAVIFVAMLVRLAIERQAQNEVVTRLRNALNQEVAKAFVDVNAQVGLFNTTVAEVNASLKTIQVMTGGSLYAQKLKPADRQVITTTFLDPAFFRPSYDLAILLTPKEEDLIAVEITTDARLQNISNRPQPLKISAFLDNNLMQQGARSVPTASKFHRFEFGADTPAGRESAARQPFIVSQEGNEKFVREVGDRLVFAYDPKINIGREEIYFVKMSAEQQMRRSDLFVWTMAMPTEKLHFTVRLAGELTTENFTLIARAMHHGEPDNFEGKPTGNKEMLWCIENVVLPFQGIQLWWSPKPAPPGAGKSADVARAAESPVIQGA